MSTSNKHAEPPGILRWAPLFAGIPAPTSSAFPELCSFCDTYSSKINATLPWLAAEIGDADGYAMMFDFITRWSGMRLHVPKQHAQFCRKFGCEISEATHREILRFGGSSQIEVPSTWGVFLGLRRVAIALASESGLPRGEVARRFGVTMRSLR